MSSSGALIVAVLQPMPFPKCASNSYKATQTPHTYMSQSCMLKTQALHLGFGHSVQCVVYSAQCAGVPCAGRSGYNVQSVNRDPHNEARKSPDFDLGNTHQA